MKGNKSGQTVSKPKAGGRPLPIPTHGPDRRNLDQHVDVERRHSADRRLAERVDTLLEVDYGSDDTFLFADTANITNLSSMGIFVQTRKPAPVGTELTLRFTPPNSADPLVVSGVVVWTNPFRPDDTDNRNPGMGIELQDLNLEQRQVLVELVRCIALLPESH